MQAAWNKFKGIDFGSSTSKIQSNVDTIDVLDSQDFLIERRVDLPFEHNRFFRSALLNTGAHIEALQEIEDALRGVK
jgi:hypothetical protein